MIVAHDSACPALCQGQIIYRACTRAGSGHESHACTCSGAADLAKLVEAANHVLTGAYRYDGFRTTQVDTATISELNAALQPFREAKP